MQRPNINLGLLFHELSKDISMGGRVNIPPDDKDWPEEWKVIEYKEYPGSREIKLQTLEELQLTDGLTDLVKKRKSDRFFSQNKSAITLKDVGTFFSNACSKFLGSDRRVHASGGARYPLEYYILILKEGELQKGIYHYNVKNHSLELVKELEKDIREYNLFGYDWANDAQAAFFITTIPNRSVRKYGERAVRYIFLEAGHIGAMMYLVATALSKKITSIAGTRDKIIEELLEIDGEYETLIYTMVVG